MKTRLLFALLGLLGLSAAWLAADWWIALPEGRTARYVGRQACIRCHAQAAEKWKGSDHDRAMDLATPEFVLGDFDNRQLEHHGVTSKMSRRGEEFFVETEGPDGQRAEFKVKYVLGVRPLQQYLAELDRGRVQVLPVTWDTEQKRWFFVSPDEPFGPQDPLHWTGSAQNWNHMCADCHTTHFQKNYDLRTDTHHYSFSEIDVSCEACHGPGSIHIELAESDSIFWDRRYGYGLARLKDKNSRTELETCAPCHAHRRRIYPGFRPGDRFLDHYGLSLLEDYLYHADGQIDEEVYVFGSFLQSRMYREGVRCTDCHDPHTTRPKFEGNQLCTQCHTAAKYDGEVHHRHKFGSQGALCVECHMPAKKFMVVDPRRDHSLRVPRPDLTVSIGTPNACNGCHTKEHETPQWAADKIVQWYGPQRRQDPHYGEVFAAGRWGKPEAEGQLAELIRRADVGPIVRATAVAVLATRYSSPNTQKVIQGAFRDRDPMVRAAALRRFDGWRATSRAEADEMGHLLVPLLNDRVRLVRTEAARLLAQIAPAVLSVEEMTVFQKVLEEFKAGQLAEADQAGAHMSLGILDSNLGRPEAAIAEYRTAIRLDPKVAGPRSNLAEVLERLGRHDEVKPLRAEEAELLARDAKLLPNNAAIHYRLGLSQYLLGREKEAEQALSKASLLEPNEAQYVMVLALLYEKQRRWTPALNAARKLIRMQPDNAVFQQMFRNFRRQASGSSKVQGPQPPPTR